MKIIMRKIAQNRGNETYPIRLRGGQTETMSGWLYKKKTNLPLMGATALDVDSKIWELLAVVSHEHYAPLCVNDATLHSGLVDVSRPRSICTGDRDC